MSTEQKDQKNCRLCNWWTPGEFNTTAGRIKIMACTMPLSPFVQTITGPSQTCDKFDRRRGGTNHG
jgi:hypothetical protein